MTDLEICALKILVRAHFDYQDERLAMDGRLGVKKDMTMKSKTPERDELLLAALYARREAIYAFELETEKEIAREVHKHPLWKAFFLGVKGCGPMVAAVCLTEFDIRKAPYVSNLWSFAGLAPGKDKKKKGEKCPYNQFLRAKLCGVLGSGFLKANSPYRQIYDDTKHRMESENWGMPSKNPTAKERPNAGHQHKAATRRMVKEFLKDLYVAWRTIEGLPVAAPYQETYLGHIHGSAV
jgi:hypothetical protein